MLLPYYQTRKTLTSQAKSHRAFRFSDLAFWMQGIAAPRPLKDLLIQENKMSGLLDTGTNVSTLLGKTDPTPGQHILLKMRSEKVVCGVGML